VFAKYSLELIKILEGEVLADEHKRTTYQVSKQNGWG